jgi:hypothetical protein
MNELAHLNYLTTLRSRTIDNVIPRARLRTSRATWRSHAENRMHVGIDEKVN